MKYSHGPEFLNDDKIRFRLWAPSAESSELILGEKALQMQGRDGWFEVIAKAKAGDKYKYRINGRTEVPDPASRFQPDDVDGASMLVKPGQPEKWQRPGWEDAVIYELHVGTFSPEGTYKGVQDKLDYLAGLGVTAIELMPIAEFKGGRGWGYDGVLPYAPHAAYGTPEELRKLISAAHDKGLMVLLDVVYNHFGPAGNYLNEYAKDFFTEKYQTPWGAAINYETQKPVRDFFVENAIYWLTEYGFDGLRFDAVHAIADNSEKHFIYELGERIREAVPDAHLVLENDKNEARYLDKSHFNAQWNDDIHHVFHVLLSGEDGGYYVDYKEETLSRLGRCLTQGFDYQGDASAHRKGELRGENSAHLPPTAFVNFLQNHDQIGNRAMGDRLSILTSPEKLQLATVILLLSPAIPMLYMGEEWASKTPFLYFCDFEGELADAVREGRRKEFSSFPEFSKPEMREKIPDPNKEKTFIDSKLNWDDLRSPKHQQYLQLVTELLALRKKHIVPLLKAGMDKAGYTMPSEKGIEIAWNFKNGKELKMVANFSDSPFPLKLKGVNIWDNFGEILPPWQCAVVIGETNG